MAKIMLVSGAVGGKTTDTSTLLPLSGGTLTGSLVGTSGSFASGSFTNGSFANGSFTGDIAVEGNGSFSGSITGVSGSFSRGSIVNLHMNGSLVNLSAGSVSGFVVKIQAGEALSYGSLVYGSTTATYYNADADFHYNMPAIGIMAGTVSAGSVGNMLLYGYIRNDNWNWTAGSLVYASTTTGEATHTRPSGSGDQVQAVGFAVSADILFFNPQYHVIEVT